MEIAKVDLRGVEPGGAGWEAARAAVTASMVAHGCVVIAHDALGVDLRRTLFSRVMPELFALPLEVKQGPSSMGGFKGYIGQRPGTAYESLRIGEPATDAAGVRGFAQMLWPEGNPEFCETIVSFTKYLKKLEEMVETMVLDSLGVRQESIGAHLDSLAHGIRLWHYGVPLDTESSMSMVAHSDDSMITMILQHEVEGLELQVGDGRWVAAPIENDTITIMAGEQLQLVTNGRVPACIHRVRTPSNRKRFSVLFNRRQKVGVAVRALEDFVDAEHPLVYNPLRHEEYAKWRYTEEGFKYSDPLKFYCGVDKDKVVGAMA